MHADSPQKYIWTCIYTCTYTHMHVNIHTHTCIHIYMYTYTYTYTYINTWIHIHTHAHIHVHIHIHIYICLCTIIYIYIYIYRIRTSCREREANVYADVHNICLTYTPAHAWCCKCMPTLCKKNAYGLVYVRLFNCAAASLPWRLLRTYLESCANIVQVVVYCPPYCPPRVLLTILCATLFSQQIRPNPR